jgi:hypothetical protein
MTATHRVVSVEDVSSHVGADQPIWLVGVDRGDPLLHAIHFPHEILVQRVADYGVDPTDVDTLLDIALYEQYMVLSPNNSDFVYHVDEKTARDGHLGRVSDLKKQYVYHDPNNLLDQIKAKHDPKDPRIAERTAKVRDIRARQMRHKG